MSLCALTVSACVPPPAPPTAAASALSGGLVPPANAEYLLGPGDEVEITFARTPEFNSRQIIRADGAISLTGLEPPGPIELRAANIPVRELQRALVQAYSGELKNPTIAVTIRTYGAAVVYVTGEVGRPGPVPFVGAMTALQAVAAAEGAKPSAKLEQVLVIRSTLPGRPSWRVIDLQRALHDADFRDDVPLSPRDVIYVPRSKIGDVGAFVDLYIRKVLPVEPGVSVPLQ
jgi:protein involved in polysaccharide export with SLBB domain